MPNINKEIPKNYARRLHLQTVHEPRRQLLSLSPPFHESSSSTLLHVQFPKLSERERKFNFNVAIYFDCNFHVRPVLWVFWLLSPAVQRESSATCNKHEAGWTGEREKDGERRSVDDDDEHFGHIIKREEIYATFCIEAQKTQKKRIALFWLFCSHGRKFLSQKKPSPAQSLVLEYFVRDCNFLFAAADNEM